jgi:hypothetical protein
MRSLAQNHQTCVVWESQRLLYGKIEEPFNQGKRTQTIPKFSHPSFGI